MAGLTQQSPAEVVPRARAEAPLTLAEPPPRALGLLDQIGLWANLGVSILGPVGAVAVLQPAGHPPLAIGAAVLSVVVGTVLGTLAVAVSAIPGAQTGAPAMVVLRGLFGARLSYLPTALNVLQCIGWSIFEIVVISSAAAQLLPWHHARVAYVVAAGALTTVMAWRPLGAVRVLRRYAIAGVAFATVYLFVQLLRHPLPPLGHGSWSGFWTATDVTVAVAVSWVPLASDYSRHSVRPRTAFAGAFIGYTLTQVAYYVLGVVALATVVRASANPNLLQHDMFAAFIAVPAGWLAFGILVLRELDQSFADTYSTVMSVQNLRPLLDRRLLALAVGAVATGCAVTLNIASYEAFLYLLGSVFVPLFGVLAVDYFVLGSGRDGGRHWDVSGSAPSRLSRLGPWVAGFAAYQVVNPGSVSWWASGWASVDGWLGLHPPSWVSASVLSFLVAAFCTALLGLPRLRRRAG
jgi:NCS1 family nucleobase:cation symporter-1